MSEAPTVRFHTSPGQRLGLGPELGEALKGRFNISYSYDSLRQGSMEISAISGALPRLVWCGPLALWTNRAITRRVA